MIRIFIISTLNKQCIWEVSAVQYIADRRKKNLSFRINVNGRTVDIIYEDIAIVAGNNGIIEISAYMTEEEISDFESRF